MATTVVMLVWAIAWYHVRKLDAYVEGNYQQEYVPGNSEAIWVKSK